MLVVVFPGHQKVKAAMDRQLAIVYKNHTAGCIPCQNGTLKNPQTHWRWKGTAAPPPEQTAPLPGMPCPPGKSPAPPGDAEANKMYEIEGIPSRCVYMHSQLPNTQLFNHNTFAKDSKRNKDFIPNC
jgi:hypothetical protein